MIDINYYINEILKFEDSIVIQGLGSFSASYKTAELNLKSKSITPPTKSISFNDKQKTDNGRLVEFIQQKENLPDSMIRKAIEDYAAHVLNVVESGEHYRITGLGYLYKDKAYKIQFIQDTTENILLDVYGMEEIEWDLGKENSKTVKETKESKSKSKSKLLIIPIALLVVAILVLSILISEKMDKTQGDSTSLIGNMFSFDRGEKEISKESLKVARNIDSLTAKKNALYFEERKNTVNLKYYLIAGSFSIYNNAEIFKKELDAKGFDAEILEVDGKIFRVSMKTFSNKNDALQELSKIKSSNKNYSLWILSAI